MTTYLASAAGFSNAKNIGIATQSADAPNSPKDAMYGGVSHKNMKDYHFVSQERLASLRAAMYANPEDLESIGDYFHALEDTYAHSTGKGDRNWEYYNDADIGLGYTTIGHGFHGHDPDFTWYDVAKANTMAKTVYDEMVAFAKYQNISGGSSWSSIESTVNKFNSFEPSTYTDIIKQRLTTTATFEGYNQKIQILNGGFKLGTVYQDQYKDAAHRNGLRSTFKSRQVWVEVPIIGSNFLIYGY